MELPRYPTTTPVEMPDDGPARQTATALLVLECVLLGLSLPVQLFLLLSLGWEGGDEALKHRLLDVIPILLLGALLAAVLSGVSAVAVHRSTGESGTLTVITSVLAVALGLGWLIGLRGSVLSPLWASAWVVLTASPAVALAILVVHSRVGRPGPGRG